MFIISYLVTFSIQIIVLMLLWVVASIFFKLSGRAMHVIQTMLTFYGIIIFVIFYTVIVPLNGWSSTWIDAMIHIIVPAAFFTTNKQKFAKMPLWWFMIYPILYFGFVHYVSYRRGYMLYQFLDNIGIVCVMCGLFMGMHRVSQM